MCPNNQSLPVTVCLDYSLNTLKCNASGWEHLILTFEPKHWNERTLEETKIEHISLHQAVKNENLALLETELKVLQQFGQGKLVPKTKFKRKILALKINRKDIQGLTALHIAAQKDNTRMCQLLYDYSKVSGESAPQLDIFIKDNKGATAIHYAAQGKFRNDDSKIEMVENEEYEPLKSVCVNEETSLKKLLTWGNDKMLTEVKDDNGMTPLHWAAKHNNICAAVQLVTHFLKRNQCETSFITKCGPKAAPSKAAQLIDHQDNYGRTALLICAAHDKKDTAKLLVKSNADMKIKDGHGWTALHYAASEGNSYVCRLILQQAKDTQLLHELQHMVDGMNNTPLHVACEKGNLEAVELLLEYDVGGNLLSKENQKGNTPLILAASIGGLDIIKLLLKGNVDVNHKNNEGKTALHFAARFNHTDVLQYLVSRGANPRAEDGSRIIPIVLAAHYGSIEALYYLLENHGYCQFEDHMHKTCLHWAVEANRLEVAKVLICHKLSSSSVGLKDPQGNTALHIASTLGYHHVVRLLLGKFDKKWKKCDRGKLPIHLAAQNGHTEVIKIILDFDPGQICSRDKEGNTPLINAALNGKEDAAFCLVEQRANLDQHNSKQLTALSCCAMNDYTKTALHLLKAGASTAVQNSNGATPLHIACMEGSASMVKLLLKYDASVTARDGKGYNPLDLAIKYRHKACAKEIIQSSKWKAALRNMTVINEKTGLISTPLREMIKSMPDTADLVFNRCTVVSTDYDPEDDEFWVEFNFEFLDDMYTSASWKQLHEAAGEMGLMVDTPHCFNEDRSMEKSCSSYSDTSHVLRDNHPLALIVNHNSSQLLHHPLVLDLLSYKWSRYGRNIYYALLLVYFVFLSALSAYLLSIPPPYGVVIKGNGSNVCFELKDGANAYWKREDCTCCQYGSRGDVFNTALSSVVLVVASLSLLKEVFQAWKSKLAYFLSFDNYMEVASYSLAITAVLDWSEQTKLTGIKEDWQWQLAAICMLTSWLTLALFLRKLPTLGIYVIMILDIVKTFAKFFATFLLFIIAFAYFFYMLLQNQAEFNTWWGSLIKTTVMMIGEMDFSTIFYSDQDECSASNSTTCYSKTALFYPELTYSIFAFFLVLMPIIVMNLLVGLAVDDIKSVQNQANDAKMGMQIQLALEVEFMLPQALQKHFVVGVHRIYPNKIHKQSTIKKFLFNDKVVTAVLTNKWLSQLHDQEESRIEMKSKVAKQSESVKRKIKKLMKQCEELNENIRMLARESLQE
uniref:transient receptor potential cation channel subfamily A member 1 homolog isoform X2 n=1 Tax=Ciona intestinalis TaxID=7719 RepID=UPI00089DB654|nr:transient receptor potential cation channel subfamily A member 1 homolog isoform X2 [Ciona intestinalis]|eukprot:XP_026693317.1 transient receptor potential cation channel subfamily A member 1 homolog isoform X2 [Ciona intestinalis]